MVEAPAVNRRDTEPPTPDRALWSAVILQALDDATGYPPGESRRSRPVVKAEARQWFEDAGPSFVHACTEAGLDPAAVRAGALRFIASGRTLSQLSTGPRRPPADDGDDW